MRAAAVTSARRGNRTAMPDDSGVVMPDLSALSRPGLRILVVDDEPAIVDLLARYLRQQGADVVQAAEADQAMRMVATDSGIGVVVSDISMPGKNGLLLTEQLLAGRDDSDALEVIIITGFATTEAAIGAMRARAFDLIRKPLRLAETAEIVARAAASCVTRRGRAVREAEIRESMSAAEEERRRLAEQLRETQSGLQHSERARAGILSVVSHELRTPLIPVLGFSEFIAASPDLPPEDLRDYALQIHRAGRDMLKLIEIALDVVALQDGGGLGPRAGAWVVTLVGRVAEGLGERARQRGVALALEGALDVAVYGDLERIERAVHQLADNAVKASPAGGVVQLASASHGPGHTRIEVLDRGPGIPAQILAAWAMPS